MAFHALFLGTIVPAQAQEEITLVPTAELMRSEWKYVTDAPPLEWYEETFDDAAWSTGLSGFGTEGTPGADIGTVWNTSDIWMRKTFNLFDAASIQGPHFRIHHDEAVEIYLNGTLVALLDGYTTRYELVPLSESAKALLKEGDNVIAVHCNQTAGGQYIDVGLTEVKPERLTRILPDARHEMQEWKYTQVEPGTSNWFTSGYSDEDWNTGFGGFGNVLPGMDPVQAGTAWTTNDIWLRKTFTLEDKHYSELHLDIFHDEDVEVFLNGTLVLQLTGYLTGYSRVALDGQHDGLLQGGPNLIAVHCRQTTGGQYIDVGVAALVQTPTEARAQAVRAAGAPEAALRRGADGRLRVGVSGAGKRAGYYDFNGRWSRPRSR